MWRWSAYRAKSGGLGHPCDARNKNLIFVASIIAPGPARRDRDTANCQTLRKQREGKAHTKHQFECRTVRHYPKLDVCKQILSTTLPVLT